MSEAVQNRTSGPASAGESTRGVRINGALLIRERKKRGFSQAAFCSEFGLSRRVLQEVESNPNRRVDPRTLAAIAAALGVTGESLLAEASPPRLLTTAEDILATNLRIVRSAKQVICATGSRSRSPEYLSAIEQTISERPTVAYFRILFDTPATPEILQHLRRMLVMRNTTKDARRSVSVGIFANAKAYPSELGLCLNERMALFVLPSVHGAWRYDTAVVFEDATVVAGWWRWIEEMYQTGRPIETNADLAKFTKAHR